MKEQGLVDKVFGFVLMIIRLWVQFLEGERILSQYLTSTLFIDLTPEGMKCKVSLSETHTTQNPECKNGSFELLYPLLK